MLFLTRPAAQRVEALDPAMMTYVVSVVRCPSRRGIFSPLHNPHPSCAGVVQCGVNERPNEVALEVSRLAEKRPLVVRSTSCQKAEYSGYPEKVLLPPRLPATAFPPRQCHTPTPTCEDYVTFLLYFRVAGCLACTSPRLISNSLSCFSLPSSDQQGPLSPATPSK